MLVGPGSKGGDFFPSAEFFKYFGSNSKIKVGSTAQKKGFDGPVIGAKMSEKNQRNFDDETMKAGQNIIGLQVNYSLWTVPHRFDLISYQ